MPRRIEEFWASASACEHMLDKHGVTYDEALEAAESSTVYQSAKAPGPALKPTDERRYLLAGKTDCGRRLWVVFADEGDGRGRIITAREARGRAERARHKSMKGD